jgi:hypothetical protein
LDLIRIVADPTGVFPLEDFKYTTNETYKITYKLTFFFEYHTLNIIHKPNIHKRTGLNVSPPLNQLLLRMYLNFLSICTIHPIKYLLSA